MVLAKTQEFYCYRCGHPRDNHRKVIRIATRETLWVDCLRPVGERTLIVHVCQCAEYRSKEDLSN